MHNLLQAEELSNQKWAGYTPAGLQSLAGSELYGFQSPRIRIPQAKISWQL